MLRINIQQTYGKIAIQTQKAPLDLQSKLVKVQIETTPAVAVSVRKTTGTLSIDQYPSRASYNLKNNTDFTRDFAQRGMDALQESIGENAAEGDQLMRIENSTSAAKTVAQMATQALEPTPVEWNYVSFARPEINYELNTTPGDYTPWKSNISYDMGEVTNNTGTTQVRTSMAQYPSIRFWTTGNRTDMRI
ncbi:MAG TPA: DUF6470 family protein [Patescibacteria group bacterium]|nr:DUF6470 family protein [Patescibacteria group bacterium]